MRCIVLVALPSLILVSCGNGDTDDLVTDIPKLEREPAAKAAKEPVCHDCDGMEREALNAILEAAREAKETCGGPVESIENQSALAPSGYRCVR